jgi:hypothetical protein
MLALYKETMLNHISGHLADCNMIQIHFLLVWWNKYGELCKINTELKFYDDFSVEFLIFKDCDISFHKPSCLVQIILIYSYSYCVFTTEKIVKRKKFLTQNKAKKTLKILWDVREKHVVYLVELCRHIICWNNYCWMRYSRIAVKAESGGRWEQAVMTNFIALY